MVLSSFSRRTPRLFLLLLILIAVSGYVHVSTKYFPRNAAVSTRHCSSKSGGEYEDLTVIELKRILREKGLPVSGVKAELITRLTSSSSKPIDTRVVVEKNEVRREAVEDYERKKSVPSSVRKGIAIEVKIVKYGALGASVEVVGSEKEAEGSMGGLILQDQLDYWIALNGREPRVGEVLNAYVQKVRDDGKLDIVLRPVGYDKVTEARERILEALEQSKSGSLPVGDKSSPEDVWAQFPGMSKGQFKTGIGALLREGAVKTSESVLTLVPKNERVPMVAQPYSGKSPRGWVAPEGSTLFIGNLPFTTDNMRLAEAVEKRLGYGKVASVRVSTDEDSGRPRGFAHIDFFNPELAEEALKKLQGYRVEGREIRVDMKKRVGERTRIEAPDWGESSLRGRRTADGQYLRDGRNSGPDRDGDGDRDRDRDRDRSGTWCTVYVGNLAYKVTEESLQYSIESSIGGGKGKGTVADVRIATEEGTGRKKGFAFVDFVDSQSAEMAVSELQGLIVLGRPIRLDMEGPKLKTRDRDRDRDRESVGGGRGMERERSFGGSQRGRSDRYRDTDSENYGEEGDSGYDSISDDGLRGPPRFANSGAGAGSMRSDSRSTRVGFSGRGRGAGRGYGRGGGRGGSRGYGRGRGDNMGRRFSQPKSSRGSNDNDNDGSSGNGASFADDFYE